MVVQPCKLFHRKRPSPEAHASEWLSPAHLPDSDGNDAHVTVRPTPHTHTRAHAHTHGRVLSIALHRHGTKFVHVCCGCAGIISLCWLLVVVSLRMATTHAEAIVRRSCDDGERRRQRTREPPTRRGWLRRPCGRGERPRWEGHRTGRFCNSTLRKPSLESKKRSSPSCGVLKNGCVCCLYAHVHLRTSASHPNFSSTLPHLP